MQQRRRGCNFSFETAASIHIFSERASSNFGVQSCRGHTSRGVNRGWGLRRKQIRPAGTKTYGATVILSYADESKLGISRPARQDGLPPRPFSLRPSYRNPRLGTGEFGADRPKD